MKTLGLTNKQRKELAHWIYASRTKRGWTQKDVAERVGVHPSAIGAWERMNYAPRDRETLNRLAQALTTGVSAAPEPEEEPSESKDDGAEHDYHIDTKLVRPNVRLLPSAFGHWVFREREHQDLWQAAVAAEADIDAGYLSRIERNLMSPSLEVAVRIAKALGFTLSLNLTRKE